MAIDLKAYLDESIRGSAALWAKDLAAHAGDLDSTPAPTARSVADFTYETILVNQIFAARLKGETPPSMDGFPTCPDELRSVDALSKAMTDSAQDILDAVGDLERPIRRGNGEEATAFEVAAFSAQHMMYHLGQLNYIQTVEGDPVVHWM